MAGTALADRALQHRDDLHGQGLAALAAGERFAAKRLFTQAVVAHPSDALSHAHLAYTMLLENEYGVARILYSKAIELDAGLASAYHGMANLCAQVGDLPECERYRAQGLQLRPLTTHQYLGAGSPVELLLLGANGSSNIDTKNFFDPYRFRVHALSVEYYPETRPLPHFDLCFNGIGEADSARFALSRARVLLAQNTGRILNHPEIVLRTGRLAVARLLRGINGVRTPRMVRLSRSVLESSDLSATLAAQGIGYPFLLRTPGQHTGKNLLRISDLEDVPVALQTLPGEELFAIEFLDGRSRDGLIRKYRVLSIAGELYPIHLAIAAQWKVHYFSAKTEQTEAWRKEEERFLEAMPEALGEAAMIRLRGIAKLLALDYGGIDFSVTPDGALHVYEANASMGFAEPPRHPDAEYRRPAIQRAQRAVERMLLGEVFRRSDSSFHGSL
jgi:glutathione synthase/RimK-type ligase-like ATP-grasp enzyme